MLQIFKISYGGVPSEQEFMEKDNVCCFGGIDVGNCGVFYAGGGRAG